MLAETADELTEKADKLDKIAEEVAAKEASLFRFA